MNKTIKRIYVETSVVSGMFDSNEHPAKTKPFWNAVERGEVKIIVSDVLEQEIRAAPQHIRDFFAALPESPIERIASTDESDDLTAQYIATQVVGEKSLNDCRHVALATVARADVIVSWNCRHIVKLNRIYRYNAINMLHGYPQIEIRTPYEVINDET